MHPDEKFRETTQNSKYIESYIENYVGQVTEGVYGDIYFQKTLDPHSQHLD